MGILSFLFGKQADIFNKKGEVQHDLPEKKWEAWNNRLKNNPEYNWRSHKGTQFEPKKTPQEQKQK